MKIRKKYYIFVNRQINCVFFGNKKFRKRMESASLGYFYVTNFNTTRKILKHYSGLNYEINKRNY